jgi:cytochrome c peroxidase
MTGLPRSTPSLNVTRSSKAYDQAPAPVALDATLPPESALEPFAPPPREPADDAQIALGKHLFFDSRLSGNNSLSCATCHQPDVAFTDGAVLSRGHPSTRYRFKLGKGKIERLGESRYKGDFTRMSFKPRDVS